VAQERPQFRLTPRIFRRIRCELKLLDGSLAVGYTTNISESGVALVFDEPIPISGTVQLKLMDWDINETTLLNVQVVRSIVDEHNRHYVGFQVVNRTEEQHQKLVRHMFGSAEIWAEDYVYTETPQSFWSLMLTPLRLMGAVEAPLRRAAPRFRATLSCVLNIENQFVIGFSNEVSETGISVFLKKGYRLEIGQPLRIRIQWHSGHISEFAAEVKRVEDAGGGQLKLGLAFVNLASEQRVELLKQIYRPKERLVRVAPSVSKFMHCTVVPVDGTAPLTGMTQEISELGLIVHLKGSEQLQVRQKVWVQLQWDGHAEERYPGEVVDVSTYYNNPVVLIYFDGLDMKTVDKLSQRLHEPAESKAFRTLIGE
jgi:c-di-GMP-binding flagellar brake protein YcgR